MGTQTSKQKYKRQKIDTYVSFKDVMRLKSICKKYGFDSIYQLLQYLVDCFLRVADPSNDESNEVVPHAIEEIFISPKEYHRLKRLTKNRSNKTKFELQLLIPFGEYINKRTKRLIINEEGIKLTDEIKDMFDSNSDWGNSHFNHDEMNLKQNPDQRKYKTPDDLK